MKTDRLYLVHIVESIVNIETYIQSGGETEFFRSKLIQDAVIRNLEIIGEASKQISRELKQNSREVPWKEMAGLRDILIHNYFGVDLEIVWNVVRRELPKIHLLIKQMIEEV